MKLDRMGVRDTALQWFKNYLANRKQKVDINGKLSEERGIEISIMQGSILGPILFLCYINDLHTVTSLLTLMFADDTFCLKSGHNLNELITQVNIEINKMALWFRANKLAVNKNKTKYIIFHMRGKKIDNNTLDVIYNENELSENNNEQITILERYHNNHKNDECKAYKLLGIFFDENLSVDHHIKHLTNKLSRSMYCIKRAKGVLNEKSMVSLYYALIHSHLTYCPTILACTSKTNINKIHKIQKKALRIMTNSKYNEHTGPICLKYNILPFNKIITQAQLLLMHSIHNEYAPPSFDNIWTNERNINAVLRNNNQYTLPYPRVDFFKRIPLYACPNEWNNAGDLINYTNRTTFSYALKDKLLCEVEEDHIRKNL
jgi:hypothetical protein